MSIIKSSYEIAIERTKSVEGSKESLEANELQKEGKKLVSLFLDNQIQNLKDDLKKFDKNKAKAVKEGVFQALMSNIILPQDEFGFKKNRKVGEALYAIVSASGKLGRILSELEHFFREFLEESKRLREAAETQYAPRLRKKEDELSKQLGTEIKIDPSSDPEFVSYMRKNQANLEERYNTVLRDVKEEIRKIFESKS